MSMGRSTGEVLLFVSASSWGQLLHTTINISNPTSLFLSRLASSDDFTRMMPPPVQGHIPDRKPVFG